MSNTAAVTTRPRLLRRPEVEERTGLTRSTIYRWMKSGDFPQAVRLGPKMIAWREADIDQWIESKTKGVA